MRVTELDVALGTSSPSAEQLATQANVYQMIFESYKANVPESQQSGITIWTLSDNAAEHEYWLSGDAPNLFDAMNANMPIKAYAMVLPEKISVQISAVTTGRMRMKQKEKKLRLNKV